MPRRPDVRLTRRGRLIVAVVVVAVLGGGAWRFRDVVTGEGTSAAPTPEATGSGDGAATPSPTPSPTPEPGTVRRADAESGAWLLEDDPGAAVVALAGAAYTAIETGASNLSSDTGSFIEGKDPN